MSIASARAAQIWIPSLFSNAVGHAILKETGKRGKGGTHHASPEPTALPGPGRALLLCLTGCGQIRPSGTTDSAAPAAESDLLQFQVGRQSRTLAPGDHYDCRDGSTERLHIQTEETLDQLAGNITTSNGVTIGSTIDDVMELLQPPARLRQLQL